MGLRCCSAMCLPSATWGGGKGLFHSRSPAGLKKSLVKLCQGGGFGNVTPSPWALSLLVADPAPHACGLCRMGQEAEGWPCMRPSSSKHKVSLPPLLITI